jgi:hypothetical protein
VEAQTFQQQLGLDAGQMDHVIEQMEITAIQFRDDVVEKMAVAFRAVVAPGLDMQLGMLNDQEQNALAQGLRNAAQAAIKGNQLEEIPTMESAERSTLS